MVFNKRNKNILSRERGDFKQFKINNKNKCDNEILDFYINFSFDNYPRLRKLLIYGICAAGILAFVYENVNFEYHKFRTGKHIISNERVVKKISIDKGQSSKQWLNVFNPVPNGHIYVTHYDNNTEILSLHGMSKNGFYRLAVFKFSDGFYEVFFRSNDKSFVLDKTLWFIFRSEQSIDSFVIGSVSDIVLGNFTKSGLDERAVVELNDNNCKDKFEQFVKILGY